MLKPQSLVRCPKVVIICQVFYPDSQSTSQLLTDLVTGMDPGEFATTVITGYTGMQNGTCLRSRETMGAVTIRRTGLRIHYKHSLVLRALHYVGFLAGATLELWKMRRCALVVGVTNPPFTPIWLWFCRRLFLQRYQILLQDIYPDGLVGIGKLKADGLLARVWRAANRKALQSADRITVLGRDMGELVAAVYGVPRSRIDYIPHWSVVPSQEPMAAESTRLIARLNLKGKFLVQYSGNMGLWHDLESIVKAAAELQGRAEIHFLMIGDGVRRAKAQKWAEELGLKNMSWLPFQPREGLKDSLSCCHLALLSQRAELKGVAVPCKLYGILASGRPVLAMVPAGTEVDLVVHEEDCGRTLAPGDVAGLVATILELESDRRLVAKMGLNAFRAYQQKYTLPSAIQRYRAVWGQSLGLMPA